MLPKLNFGDLLSPRRDSLSNGQSHHHHYHGHNRSRNRLPVARLPELDSSYSMSGRPSAAVTWPSAFAYSSRQDEAYPNTYVSPRVNAYSLDSSGASPPLNYQCSDPSCSRCKRDLLSPSHHAHVPLYDTSWRRHLFGDTSTGKPHHQRWMYTHNDGRPRYDTNYDLRNAPSDIDAIDWASHRNASLYNRLHATHAMLHSTVQQLRAFDNRRPIYDRDFDLGRPFTPFEIPPSSR